MTTTTMAAEIAALRTLPTSELARRYTELYGKPPRVKHRQFLWKRIAWRMQEQRTGGLPQVARDRLEELIAEIDIPIAETTRTVTGRLHKPGLRAATNPDGLVVGSVLQRDWKGQRLAVRVTSTGFEHAGVPYPSLSAVARGITGSRWNGRLFFGLVERGGAK